MFCDDAQQAMRDHFEISSHFRRTIEGRIARLEADAASDENTLRHLENSDHIRRQSRLVSAQREEAARMRRFLQHSDTRQTRTTQAL
ncbi:MAG TPA: hypothetical protein VN753_17520 [Terracidiphilus sp.]|jgi:hypothetical protein|nr:hypothetical protein [Terracidiphilus sp.]